MDTPETNSSVNRSSSLFFPSNSFLFQWVSIHSHSILKKKAQNPLFLQPNRSFDFGMNSSFHQYAVSYTHLYTSVSTL